ncbi:hypothetical protein CHLRE_02g117050v5 [Chlamydomonas reinhardtii]|uniref:Protein kinase domain-containing protein n=1 Tax=Chlamydomonas reinhardtii TaxID=3055 RepID=A0A2K3E3I1_CHLRE|nr:uncharacterized protein CHLRE_02g117050v5 [Chlamydomonas reinhardtii]PNW87297.1 hypothetical protein CHLRE_02g117050v5 [Chlamydomonas reinhardtii]
MGQVCCKDDAAQRSPEGSQKPAEPAQVPQPIARDGGAAVAVPVPATSAAPAPTAAPGSDTPAGSTAQVPAAPFSSALASNTTRASLSATDLVNLTLHEAVPPVAPASAAPATGPAPDAASKAAGSAEAPALIAADAGAAAPAADAAAALVTNAAAVSATPERWVPPSDGHDAAGLAPLPSSTGLPPVRSIGDLTAFTAASGGGAGSGVDPGSLPPVKVETTRRHNAAAEGSSSAGYSASATSSQQQGAGGSSIVQGGAGSSIVQGAGGSSAAQGGAGSSSQGPTLGSSAAGPAGSSVADSNTTNPDGTGGKAAGGFMFGAPRVKEHKEKRRKEAKRAKSHTSSNASSNPKQILGSEGQPPTEGSKGQSIGASSSGVGPATTATGGTGTGGGAVPAIAGSSSMAPPNGSSAMMPSIGSSDNMMSSSNNMHTGMGSPTVGSTAGTAAMQMEGSSGANPVTNFKSIGRSRAQRGPVGSKTPGEGSSGRGSSGRLSSIPTQATGLATPTEGAPPPVPEGEEEGESQGEGEDSGSSPRSSSEHLSIMSPPEGSDVENVLQLICNVFQLPVALVAAYRSANIFIRSTALKLTDDDQWRYSLAQWAMLNVHDLRDVLLVPDATLDDRFRTQYCVANEPRVRFFCASPLRSSTGELLGTLCMADFQERMLEPANLLVVNNLQSLVIRQLERDMALAAERLENEVATEQLQQEMMRALDHFEKCIMFVDTSKPGWEVLYTNLAWEHVTGVPRVHVLGRSLQDFFMALGGASLDWSSTAAELASRSEFTVNRVAVRQKPDKLVSLHLRLATNQASGELEGLLPKGLPAWVKARGSEAHNYFVFVEEAMGGSTVYEALAKHVEKVPGLELSHLLGKGGFGSVYYGTWNSLPVAVKMIDNRLTKTNTEGVSLEALMGQELAHPNIVKTIKYVMRNQLNASSISGSNSRGPNSSQQRPGRSGQPLGSQLNSRNPHVTPPPGSRHGSRNPPHGTDPAMNAAAAAALVHARGATGATSANPGMMQYLTSANPGAGPMTSAQIAAAADLTSASGMNQLQLQHMVSTMTSDATTVAGGGTDTIGSSGMPGRPANLVGSMSIGTGHGSTPLTPNPAAVAAAAAAMNAAELARHVAATATAAPHGKPANADGDGDGESSASGITAVGPASVHASSASTAAGPPSMASAGMPANAVSPANMSHSASATALYPRVGSSGRTPNSAQRTAAAAAIAAAPPLPATLPPLAAPVANPALATSITAAYPPGAPPPNLTAAQQVRQTHAAMTSRFSLAFSTITEGGDVLVPEKGSPSSSTDSHTQRPNVGSAGSGEDMGEVWIIMEFCDRGSLQDALDRGALKLRKPSGEMGETHLPMMVATACEVASALQYLHDKGIVHGDLTAWNVMLCTAHDPAADRSGRNFVAKVADFGLSRNLDVRSKIKTRTYGTISHMPPECLISGIISKATDVFAFGVLLWQMYTGLRPWAGMNHGQIIYNVGMKNVQLLFPPGTPPAIADLSSSCTRTDPTTRPSFGEIMDKLGNIRASLGL